MSVSRKLVIVAFASFFTAACTSSAVQHVGAAKPASPMTSAKPAAEAPR